MDARREVALNEGSRAQGVARLGGAARLAAYQRVARGTSQGYKAFQDRKWDDISEVMWGTMAKGSRISPTTCAALAASVRAAARPRRRTGRAVRDRVARMVVRSPARTRGDSRRRPFAASRTPKRGSTRSRGFSRRCPAAAVEPWSHGGRLAVEVLQRHGVDTMFTLSGGHLFVLYDGAVQAGLRLSTSGTSRPRRSRPKGWAK